ncbi:aldehyde dehydrogenase family protein [Mycobacteroides abscessus]
MILAPANHPDVHLTILEAFAFGYKVLVRPSARDPFTPARIVAALLAAGAPQDTVALLPCGHEQVKHLLRAGDLTVVYGGDNVVREHATNPRVLAQGPGRSKIYVTDTTNPDAVTTQIMQSFAGDGGTQCINTSAVVLPTRLSPVIDAVHDQAQQLIAAPPENPTAQLPVMSLSRAQTVASYAIEAHNAHHSLQDLVIDLGDGSAALRPLISTDTHVSDIAKTPEVAFPAVKIIKTDVDVQPADLGRTLALSIHSTRPDKDFQPFIESPLIRNIFFGETPTTTVLFGMPHDGSLADFLMETKTVIRSHTG